MYYKFEKCIKNTAAKNVKECSKQHVGQDGAPKCKQVERFVAVRISFCCVLVVVWFINGEDRHITCRNKVKEKQQ